MPSDEVFISHAPNHEDVVLWRALGQQRAGRYVEVTTGSPDGASIGRAFTDRGWAGLTVGGPTPPGQAMRPATTATLDDSLGEHGWSPDQGLHFLAVTSPGASAEALSRLDLRQWRPWLLVLDAVVPGSGTPTHQTWEPDVLAAGYEFCLFDGVSRFYVAAEQAATLRDAVSHPACVRDDYVSASHHAALRANEEMLAQTTHWRTLALTQWADALSGVLAAEETATGSDLRRERDHLRDEVLAFRQTLSWRVTRPLRAVRPLIGRVRAR